MSADENAEETEEKTYCKLLDEGQDSRNGASVVVEDEGQPRCVMCEDDSQSPAVMFCSKCEILYCKECRSRYHPDKKPLQAHKFLSIRDYLTQQKQQQRLQTSNGTKTSTAITESDLNIRPLPKDIKLRTFLLGLSRELLPDDIAGFKYVMKGDGGITPADAYGCKTALEIFDILHKYLFLTMNNIVVLQAMIWCTGRKDLYNKLVDFASKNADIIHICTPPEPVNGYKDVKIHVKGHISRDFVEEIRSAAARWLCIPDRFIIVSGLEPTGSWFVTLMIPEVGIKRLKEVFTLHKDWLLQRDIDRVELCGQVFHFTNADKTGEPNISPVLVIACRTCSHIYIPDDEYAYVCPTCEKPGGLSYWVRSPDGPASIRENILGAIKTFKNINEDIGHMDQFELQILMRGCLDSFTITCDNDTELVIAALSQNNMLLLREVVWFTERTDLYEQMVDLQIATRGVTPIRDGFNTKTTVAEYEEVKIATSAELNQDIIEDLRSTFSRWLCIPVYTIQTQITQPRKLTLEIPKGFVSRLADALELHSEWLKQQGVHIDDKHRGVDDPSVAIGSAKNTISSDDLGDRFNAEEDRSLPEGKEYHLFFAYSSHDAMFVREKVRTLENPPFNLKCCFRNTDFITMMLKSMHVVLVLTSEFFASSSCHYEKDLAIQLRADNLLGVIPLIHKACPIPVWLKSIYYVDETKGKVAEDEILKAVNDKGEGPNNPSTWLYSRKGVEDSSVAAGSAKNTISSDDIGEGFNADEDRRLPEGKEYHLFFAYSSHDAMFVREKVRTLENPPFNLKCCFSDRDFIPGVSIDENIKTLMLKSMHVVLVFTPEFLASSWCRYEKDMALQLRADDLLGVTPLIHKACPIPVGLKSFNYIDETTGKVADEKILKAVYGKVERPNNPSTWLNSRKGVEDSSVATGSAKTTISSGEGFIADEDRSLPEGKEYHLFFAYSSHDAMFVREKVRTLEKPPFNLKCCFSDRDFVPGVSILENIETLMLKSMHVVLVLTPEFLASGWCRYAKDMALQLRADNLLGVTPLIHKACPIPVGLKSFNCVDETTGKVGDDKILKAVSDKVGRPKNLSTWLNSRKDVEDANVAIGSAKMTISSDDIEKGFKADEDRSLPEGKEYHLFFAYSSDDAMFVREKVRTLEKPPFKLKCCYSDRDFLIGDSVFGNIATCMLKSMHVVLVLTSEFLASGLCHYEMEMALRLRADNLLGVIPLIHKACPIPDCLETFNYIDETTGKVADDRILKAVFDKAGPSNTLPAWPTSRKGPVVSKSDGMGEDEPNYKRVTELFDKLDFRSRRGVISLREAKGPEIRFTKTSQPHMKIRDNGLKVVFENLTETNNHAEALTDGTFNEEKFYWVINVVIKYESPDSVCRALLGVVQEGSDLWTAPGRKSWCIDMEYHPDRFIALSPHGATTEPGYRDWLSYAGSHDICVVLDCGAKTLNFIDMSQKEVMLCHNINMSKPLTPAIRFECTSGKISATASLALSHKLQA